MKKNITESVLTLCIVSVLLWTGRITDGLPWWIFVVPVFGFGLLVPRLKWRIPAFGIGFLSGFLTWALLNVFFDSAEHSILTRIGSLLSVPRVIVWLIAGLIGGLLTGLALYSGERMFSIQEDLEFEQKMGKAK